jgi:hypothetical protein
MKRIIFLLLIITFSISCKKEKSNGFSSRLTGEWSWISTCLLGGAECMTSVSTHTSRNLVFTSDSLFYVYQNDTLRISSNFHTYDSGSEDGYIKYGNDSGNADRFTVTHDTLTLVNLYGYITWVNQYKRIKY